MNVVRNVFLALGAISSLILITAGIVGYLLTGPAPVQWSTVPLPVEDDAVENLEDALEEFNQQVGNATAGESVALVLVDEEVGSKLNQLAADRELPLRVRDVRVHFVDGVVRGSALADLGIDVQVALEAGVQVQDGTPKISVQEFYLGRLPIPKTLTDNIIGALMGQANSRLGDLPFTLDRIDLGDGWIIIRGEAKQPSIGTSAAGPSPEPLASSVSGPAGTGSTVGLRPEAWFHFPVQSDVVCFHQ